MLKSGAKSLKFDIYTIIDVYFINLCFLKKLMAFYLSNNGRII